MNHHPTAHQRLVRRTRDRSTTRTWSWATWSISLVLGMSVPDVSGSRDRESRVETLIHRNPTFHVNTILRRTRVLEKTPSKSRMIGVSSGRNQGFNQDGLEVSTSLMVWKREFARERQRPYSATSGRNDHTRFDECYVEAAPGLARDLRGSTLILGGAGERVMLQKTQSASHNTVDEVRRSLLDATSWPTHRCRSAATLGGLGITVGE